jgi:hypothetical protein
LLVLAGKVPAPPSPSHRALARWLVTTEMEATEEPLAAPEATERVFGKLSKRLVRLITDVGADALVARAVHLSLTAFPFLGGAQIRRSDDSLIISLRETADRTESSQVAEGFEAVLATLVALLVSFIGEDLTARILREVWPELVMPQAVSPSQNDPTNLEVNP